LAPILLGEAPGGVQLSQELLDGDAMNAVDSQAAFAPIQQERFALWVIGDEALEPPEVLRAHPRSILDLDGPKAGAP